MEHQAVYERLVRAARAREFVHYGELGKRQTLPGEDEMSFAIRQIKRVHDYWSREAITSP